MLLRRDAPPKEPKRDKGPANPWASNDPDVNVLSLAGDVEHAQSGSHFDIDDPFTKARSAIRRNSAQFGALRRNSAQFCAIPRHSSDAASTRPPRRAILRNSAQFGAILRNSARFSGILRNSAPFPVILPTRAPPVHAGDARLRADGHLRAGGGDARDAALDGEGRRLRRPVAGERARLRLLPQHDARGVPAVPVVERAGKPAPRPPPLPTPVSLTAPCRRCPSCCATRATTSSTRRTGTWR